MSIFPDPSPKQPLQPPPPPAAPPPQAPPPFAQAPFAQPPYYAAPAPSEASSGGGVKFWILLGLVVALAGACVYLYTQLDKVKKEQAKTNETIQGQLD